MSTSKSIKYPLTPSQKRVYYKFDSFLKFLEQNKENVKHVRINPPRLGSNNYGSVSVKLKHK